MDDIRVAEIVVQERRMSAIRIGEASGDLPKHLMTGEKACGYLVRNGHLEPWYWENMRETDGDRYIYYPPLPLVAFSELFQSLRGEALVRLRELARAIQKLPPRFMSPTNGTIETWRIFFLPETDGFLFLPNELSHIILYSASEQTRFLHIARYMRPNMELPFGLCHQFTQFLYQAAAGFAPYEHADVREDRYRHVPLGIGFSGLSPDFAQWIDDTLAMPSTTQREMVSAAYSAEENLTWWLQETERFTWEIPHGIQSLDELEQSNTGVAAFRERQRSRASKKRFLRKRGALIASIALVGILVFSILGSLVFRSLQAPYTAGMEPVAVIEEFFTAQNELDLEKMGASLARGAKNPYEMEVSGLFVNARIRQAYEGIESVIRADRWIDEGQPPIPASSVVYGVTDVMVQPLGSGRYRTTYRAYYPVDSELEISETVPIAVVQRTTEFTLSDERGYWQIVSIEPQITEPIEVITVETYRHSTDRFGDE